MCEPDVEEIVNYLSLKFNKIFYDREFISSVSNDFLKVKSNKCCVLVFPALGPLYQRALKYQARAFDLATFCLTGRTYKLIAVCQKEYILNDNNQEVQSELPEKEMPELKSVPPDTTIRKRRPERQLYIPPAQRKLSVIKDTEHEIKQSKTHKSSVKHKSANSDNQLKKVPNEKSQKPVCLEASEESSEIQSVCKKVIIDDLATDDFAERIVSLHDILLLNFLGIPKYSPAWIHNISNDTLSLENFHENSCPFHKYLIWSCGNPLEFIIPIYQLNDLNFMKLLIENYFSWQPMSIIDLINVKEIIANNCAIPFFNYMKNPDACDLRRSDVTNSFTLNQIKLRTKIQNLDSGRCGIIKFNNVGDVQETEVIFGENNVVGTMLKIVCDSESFENVVDLTFMKMGHYLKISLDGGDYFHVCDENHDAQKCYMELKNKFTSENIPKKFLCYSYEDEKFECEKAEPLTFEEEVTEIIEQKSKEKETSPQTEKVKSKNDVSANIEKSKTKCRHEEEKEIMRKAKENINRKTRPIMKYSDDSDDLLKIDRQENINNWEDLFDDNGQIQEELLTEIVQKVGRDMTIVKASEDYTPYVPKPTYDLDHVVEIYNFPPSLSTGDIIHAFSMFDSDSMYIIWVDDTHALLVLGSSSQAQRALDVNNPLIKVRPMTSASPGAVGMASQYDLRPAMKRPPTNLQTARRLITNHLGTKSQVTKEQSAQERENLRQARELRKITRQNERDAWDGKVRSSLKQ